MKRKSAAPRPPHPAASAPRKSALAAAAPFILAAAVVAVYWNSLSGVFVLDDKLRIVANSGIRSLWPIWSPNLPPDQIMAAQRPLANFTIALNHAIGGTAMRGYHFFNLLIHLFASLALYGVVRRTLALERVRERHRGLKEPGRADFFALAAALIWAVHPLQTAAVTYVIQRAESMMGLFFLVTLYCFIRSLESARRALWRGLAVASCAMGMASKEVMAAAPIVILLYDRVFVAASWRDAFARRWKLHAALAATWILLAIFLATAPKNETIGFGTKGVTAIEYARSQFGVIAHYLRMAIVPYPQVLDYGWPVANTAGEIAPWAALVLALLVATAIALWRWPEFGFLGAAFFLILAPTSSVMPLADLAFEHRMYLPLACLVPLGAAFAGRAIGAAFAGDIQKRRNAEIAALAAISLVFGALTIVRNADYKSELTMAEIDAARRPGNARAQMNLGLAFQERGALPDAIKAFREAIKIRPDYAQAHYNLGNALYSARGPEEAEAEFREALRHDPGFSLAHNNLASLLVARGKFDEAIDHYNKAIAAMPSNAEAHYNLAKTLSDDLKRPEESLQHYENALKAQPSYTAARLDLAKVLGALGRREEAMAQLQEARRLDPGAR